MLTSSRCRNSDTPADAKWPLCGRPRGRRHQRARFLAYVTGTLIPTLKRGDTVFMDNLSAHKVSGIREAIEAAGARLLYLPAYSPDFNPIE